MRLPALVASFLHLTIESLLCCKQASPAHDRPAGYVSVCLRNVVVDRIAFAKPSASGKHPLCKCFASVAVIVPLLLRSSEAGRYSAAAAQCFSAGPSLAHTSTPA